jgi:hypothetical protein
MPTRSSFLGWYLRRPNGCFFGGDAGGYPGIRPCVRRLPDRLSGVARACLRFLEYSNLSPTILRRRRGTACAGGGAPEGPQGVHRLQRRIHVLPRRPARAGAGFGRTTAGRRAVSGERHRRGHHGRGRMSRCGRSAITSPASTRRSVPSARTAPGVPARRCWRVRRAAVGGPRILASAVTAAAQVAVRRWSAADPPVPLGPLLRRALEQLATACSGMSAGG